MTFYQPRQPYEDPMPNPPEASRHEDRSDPYPDPLPTEKQPQAASQTPPAMRDRDHLQALVATYWFLPLFVGLLLCMLTLGLLLGVKIASAKHRQPMLHPSTNQSP
jgi:hypothetical protein